MLLRTLLVVLVVALGGLAGPAAAARLDRHALLVANETYDDDPLDNPKRDVQAIAARRGGGGSAPHAAAQAGSQAPAPAAGLRPADGQRSPYDARVRAVDAGPVPPAGVVMPRRPVFLAPLAFLLPLAAGCEGEVEPCEDSRARYIAVLEECRRRTDEVEFCEEGSEEEYTCRADCAEQAECGAFDGSSADETVAYGRCILDCE